MRYQGGRVYDRLWSKVCAQNECALLFINLFFIGETEDVFILIYITYFAKNSSEQNVWTPPKSGD